MKDLLFIFLLTIPAFAFAQSDTSKAHVDYWISGGLGLTLAGPGDIGGMGYPGITGRVAANVLSDHTIISARITATTDWPSGNAEELFDSGLLVGHALQPPGLRALFFATGIAAVWGDNMKNGGNDRFGPIIGLPVEAGFLFNMSKTCGAGFILHANINAKGSFAGLTFNLLLGKFH